MKTLLSIGCMIAVMVCVIAQAHGSTSVTCQNGRLTRIVEITYGGTPGEPPCEVHYKKTTEQPGHDEVLWNSEHTKNYCETKQQEFVEMLRGLGWACQ